MAEFLNNLKLLNLFVNLKHFDLIGMYLYCP